MNAPISSDFNLYRIGFVNINIIEGYLIRSGGYVIRRRWISGYIIRKKNLDQPGSVLKWSVSLFCCLRCLSSAPFVFCKDISFSRYFQMNGVSFPSEVGRYLAPLGCLPLDDGVAEEVGIQLSLKRIISAPSPNDQSRICCGGISRWTGRDSILRSKSQRRCHCIHC